MPTPINTLLAPEDPLDCYILDRLRDAKSRGDALTTADLARSLDLPTAGERRGLIGAVAVHALTDRLTKLVAATSIATSTSNGEQYFWIPDPPKSAAPKSAPT